MRNISKAIIGLLVIASIVGVVAASYSMTSNTVTVTVTDPVQMTLTSSTASTVSGQSITLTAYVVDQANGITVTFYDGGQSIGQAITAGGGYAKLTIEPSMGTHSYHAVGLHP